MVDIYKLKPGAVLLVQTSSGPRSAIYVSYYGGSLHMRKFSLREKRYANRTSRVLPREVIRVVSNPDTPAPTPEETATVNDNTQYRCNRCSGVVVSRKLYLECMNCSQRYACADQLLPYDGE